LPPLLLPLNSATGLEGSLTLSATASIDPSGTEAGHERRSVVEEDDVDVDAVAAVAAAAADDARIAKRGEPASSSDDRSHTAADSSTTSEDDIHVRVTSWIVVESCDG
jgi:hypothetical protein